MPLLYYWRRDNYYRDLDFGAGFNLNQNNRLLHEIDIGDSLWAFTKNKKNNYVLAAQLIIKAKTFNPPNFRYGRFRIWGDLKLSKYFSIENQPNLEYLLRNLSIKADASRLGRAYQGLAAVRRLSPEDHQVLSVYAKNLNFETRARLLPEEKLEALFVHSNEKNIYNFIKSIPSGVSEKRVEYLYSKAPKRNLQLIKELQDLYKGRCQICIWNPRDKYGESLCEGHHMHWLSRGGEDKIENLILICPNHHTAIHKVDAPFDYKELSFQFTAHSEVIKLNNHLFF
jgi:hypothetical protein